MKILILLLFASVGVAFGIVLTYEQVEQQKNVEKDGFRLRVSKLSNNLPVIMPPSKYLIESSHDGMDWMIVTRWSQDDPWPVSQIDINVMSASVAYYFNMVRYGVTVNGGKSWEVFDFYSQSVIDKIGRSADHRIPRVEIGNNGFGTLFLQNYKEKNSPKSILYTTRDFGQSWQLIKPIN